MIDNWFTYLIFLKLSNPSVSDVKVHLRKLKIKAVFIQLLKEYSIKD